MAEQGGGTKICCPQDLEWTHLTPSTTHAPTIINADTIYRGIMTLVPNLMVLQGVSAAAPQQQPSSTSDNLLCEVCTEDHHPATHVCEDCDGQLMCGSMAAAHKAMRATRNHRVVDLAEGGALPRPDNESVMCSEHKQLYVAFDVDCGTMVCGHCATVGKHVGHSCKTVEQVVGQMRDEIGAAMQRAQATLVELQQKESEIVLMKKRIEEMGSAGEKQIAVYFAKARQWIDEREKGVLKELRDISKDKLATLHDQHQRIQNLLACAQYAVWMGQQELNNNEKRDGDKASGKAVAGAVSARDQIVGVGKYGECGGKMVVSEHGMAQVEWAEGSATQIRSLLDTLVPLRIVLGEREREEMEKRERQQREIAGQKEKQEQERSRREQLEREQAQQRQKQEQERLVRDQQERQQRETVQQKAKQEQERLQRESLEREQAQQRRKQERQQQSRSTMLGPGAAGDPNKATSELEAIFQQINQGARREGAVEQIRQILHNNRSLATLDLSDEGSGDSVVKAIGKVLRSNTTLRELLLGANRVTDDGATALAQGLHENQSLKKLDLQNPRRE
eukprot:c20777_g2_i4.p1 GENE.c20777_g2_i4~~c20777_g2_i4.p1  ORF type:complete len:606 (-),score=126.15 c20777_g2_i4:33-1724(-)